MHTELTEDMILKRAGFLTKIIFCSIRMRKLLQVREYGGETDGNIPCQSGAGCF